MVIRISSNPRTLYIIIIAINFYLNFRFITRLLLILNPEFLIKFCSFSKSDLYFIVEEQTRHKANIYLLLYI